MEFILLTSFRRRKAVKRTERALYMSLGRKAAERATIVHKNAMKRFKRNRKHCEIYTYIIFVCHLGHY